MFLKHFPKIFNVFSRMYSQVAPPDSISECCMQDEGQCSSESRAVGDRQECGALVDKPGRISEEKWLVYTVNNYLLKCIYSN